MSIFSWSLSAAPDTTPEYWLLCVDGNAWCALMNVPFTGPGKYSADLDALSVPLPLGVHTLTVCLVGSGTSGPQSPGAQVNVIAPPAPAPVLAAVPESQEAAAVWPAADTTSIN